MKHSRVAITALLLMLFCNLFATNPGELTGKWKITNVQVTGKTENRCYLCDLYEHQGYLEFMADGRVTYANSPTAKQVYFYIDGNNLVMTEERAGALQVGSGTGKSDAPMADTNVTFQFTLSGGTLTLVKTFDGYTETYTLTK